MDKYNASNDHYCYPSTGVLKNKLNITSADALEVAEKEITAFKLQDIEYAPAPYDMRRLQVIHRALFSELYDWAGSIRNVDISKGDTRFCTNGRIEAEANLFFAALANDGWLRNLDRETFCEKLAMHYCELNMIHPFREGNGRVQRILFEQLALGAGYELDWADVGSQEWISANIEGVAIGHHAMTEVFKRVVRP